MLMTYNSQAYIPVKERIISTRDNHPILSQMEMDISRYKYVHCIFIDIPEKQALLDYRLSDSFDHREDAVAEDAFWRYLQRFKPTTFNDTLFCLDFYPAPFDCLPDLLHNTDASTAFEAISAILSGSKGVILWQYQLVHLLSLFYWNAAKIDSLRKDINAKKATVFDELRKIKLSDTMTLTDLIWARMIGPGQVVQNPNYKGAYALSKLICKLANFFK